MCRKCVRRYDHHCPWIANCVGEWNFCYFFKFTLCVFVISGFCAGVSISCFVLKTYEMLNMNFVLVCVWFGLIILAEAFGLIFSAIILTNSTSLMTKNLTQVERIQRIWAYDAGLKQNIQQFLGLRWGWMLLVVGMKRRPKRSIMCGEPDSDV